VHLLESTTISTLAKWDIKGVRTENPGVWAEDEEKKIAALGVHLRRNISSYGVGLNVNTDLRWFDRIVACGLVGKSVTTMSDLCRERDNFEEDVSDNLYAALKLDAVGRVWMRGFARGLYGEGGEEKIREAGFEELELD
jgi:lipoate-protein ligase B